MNTAPELYRFSQQHHINFNVKETKGTELFERFTQAFPKTNFTFSFIGFHKYENFRKTEGLTAYGISGNLLYALSRKEAYRYNLYRCKHFSGKKKLNGIKLQLDFENESLMIDLGFADGDLVLAALKQSAKK